MEDYKQIIIYVIGFIWILFASDYFAKLFRKSKLPLITGFLITGIVCGPHMLDLIEAEAIDKLEFVNDIALAFIAFAAGAELYLKEIRSHAKSIAWNIFGQLIITFVIGILAVYLLSNYIPFMKDMSSGTKLAVAILAATIFVARSPSSAIAIISEMRAKGPFTQTVMGVTVIKDVLVIVLFAFSFSLAGTIISGTSFNIMVLFVLILELVLAFLLGYIIGKIIALILFLPVNTIFKTIIILAIGYGIFAFSHFIEEISPNYLSVELHIEPLLIAIIASFSVTNYSKYRTEFRKIIDETGPIIYVAFFTLVGAMLSIDILAKVWFIALILFFVRLIAVILGGIIGSSLAGDPPLFKRISWMAYVTQAGVGLGLATEIAGEFEIWGTEFATIIIAVIVLNQLIGPPLFKWAIIRIGEAHTRSTSPKFDGVNDAIIFGLEDQSLALARQLKKHDWKINIVTLKKQKETPQLNDIPLVHIKGILPSMLQTINTKKADALILMLSDEENLTICEWFYENVGTREIIVRLNNRDNFKRFHELGALIVEPSTAMVGLLDHFVRAPIATSILLGMDEKQDSEDFELLDKELHGIAIRDLRLPADILILSVMRKKHLVVTHGYTRLRKGDIITAMGSIESLAKLRLKFGK